MNSRSASTSASSTHTTCADPAALTTPTFTAQDLLNDPAFSANRYSSANGSIVSR